EVLRGAMLAGELGIARQLACEIHDEFCGGFAENLRAKRVCRVGPERRANHRSARRERSPRPPDMERGNVAVPDGLLPPRVRRDTLDRQINFDEAFGICCHYFKAAFNWFTSEVLSNSETDAKYVSAES